jgi:hypothetical protein
MPSWAPWSKALKSPARGYGHNLNTSNSRSWRVASHLTRKLLVTQLELQDKPYTLWIDDKVAFNTRMPAMNILPDEDCKRMPSEEVSMGEDALWRDLAHLKCGSFAWKAEAGVKKRLPAPVIETGGRS